MATVLNNSIYSTINSSLRFVSNALLFIVIARFFGAEEFGKFTFAVSFTGIFLVIVDYGFNLQIIRDIATAETDVLSLAGPILSGKILLVVVSTLVLSITLLLQNYRTDIILLVYILWASAVFYSFGLFFNSIFKGLNQFKYEAYSTILLNIIQCLLIIVLITTGYKIFTVSLAYLISRIIYFVVSYRFVLNKLGSLNYRFSLGRGLGSLKYSLPFGIHTILAALYFQLDTVFLSHYRGHAEVGYYQAAMRVVLASMIICEVISSVYFPLIARYFKYDLDAFDKSGHAFNKYLLLIGCWVAIGLFLFAGPVINLIYGTQYEHAALLLRLLSGVILLRFVGGAYATVITVTDNQGMRAFGVGLSLAVNVLLNFVLIPAYGAVGAAVASIITHVVLVALYFAFSMKLIGKTLISQECRNGLMLLTLGSIFCHSLKNLPMIFHLTAFFLLIPVLFIVGLDPEEKESSRRLCRRVLSGALFNTKA